MALRGSVDPDLRAGRSGRTEVGARYTSERLNPEPNRSWSVGFLGMCMKGGYTILMRAGRQVGIISKLNSITVRRNSAS